MCWNNSSYNSIIFKLTDEDVFNHRIWEDCKFNTMFLSQQNKTDTALILVLRKQKYLNLCEFKVSLLCIVRPYLKNQANTKRTRYLINEMGRSFS